jgi:hypothetical protein
MDVLMLALVSSEWSCPKKRSYPNLVVSLLGAALGEVPRPLLPESGFSSFVGRRILPDCPTESPQKH